MSRRPSAVLFDLDGTLVDSAPDLAGAANEMRAARGLVPLCYATMRPRASSGARGMLAAAFDASPGDDGYEELRAEFLARYEARMLSQSRLFDAVTQVLDAIEAAHLRWGIVTNKSMRLAESMASGLGLLPRAAVLVGGDSTGHTKPHPAPLLEAAHRLGAPPGSCAYVGDDPRDIAAGRAAGMMTWAAGWGYLGPDGDPHTWGADLVLEWPQCLLQVLDLA